MDLTRVNWPAAAGELADEHRRSNAPHALHALATVASLRGRFTDDFGLATASTQRAIRLEPLEPMHHVRDALVRLRFGDVDGAIARLDALPEGVGDLAIVLVVKALATARRGEPRTARNIAERALTVDDQHTPARFLSADANLAAAAKGGLDKLAELPKGVRFDAAWADLLGKLAILRPGDLRAVNQHLERGAITKGSRAAAIAQVIATWVATTAPAELERIVETQPVDSRAEQVALGLLVGRLDKANDPIAAVTVLRGLRERCPERPAIRRALASALTRVAIVDAAAARYLGALRAVQMCLELEPHEAVHYQNRAALFTLLGEHDAALDAWAELDRHHYRLALVGRLDPKSVQRYAAPHRMFALAARRSPGTTRNGVFVVDDGELTTNQEGVDRDPDQLRQWLHHARAALVFGFVALGPGAWLLAPASPAIADARVRGLCTLAQSLEVLVPEGEGRALADTLAARFRGSLTTTASASRYVAAAQDAPSRAVHHHAIELYAELAMLCVQWSPDPKRGGAFDEVVETVRALAPLLDEAVLDAMLKDPDRAGDDAPAHALLLLKRVLRTVEEPANLPGFLVAHVRTSLVQRRWEDSEGTLREHDLEQALEQLDLARQDAGVARVARVEYWSARLAFAADFLDDAVAAIKRFHDLAKATTGEHPMSAAIAKLQEALDERGKVARPGKRRDGGRSQWSALGNDAKDFAAREAELEEQPTSMALYADLCHDLGLADRWTEAHAWATRALGRCLTSVGQLRARELALELAGLQQLAAVDRPAVASYLAGARASALAALERLPPGDTGLEYVRGMALLAADRRPDAQRAFVGALASCTRGIFMAVLRPLATDLETALLEAARKEIDAACAAGRFADGFARIAERMATVKRPEVYLLELARTQFAAILPTIGTGQTPVGPSQLRVDAAWHGELARALQTSDPLTRTRALAALAAAIHPASQREVDAMVRKLDDVAAQLVTATALDEAARRATAGDLDGALARLDQLGDAGQRNARALRQRAIVLLRLERYVEADAAVDALRDLPDAVAREFATRYPGLRVRQQIATAGALVRARAFERARAILAHATTTAPDQQLELAYCKACCAAAEGYRKHEGGDRGGAARLLFEALAHVESVLEDARRAGHDRLVELHGKLETDVAAVEGGGA